MITAPSTADPVISPTRFDLLSTFEAAYGANLIGCTIMRVRGYYWINVPPASVVSLRVGIKKTDNATPPDAAESLFSAGQFGGAHDDWMGFEVLAGGPLGVDGQYPPGDMGYRLVDVRSRRRIDELGERLDLYASGLGAGTVSGAVSFAFDLSVLVALP